jgi:hypothetical protein
VNDVRTVLLSAAIVEKLELIRVCCRWRVDLFMFSCVADVSMVSMTNWNKGGLFTCALFRDEISIVMKCLNKQLFVGD